MKKICIRARVSGKVQGVCFRQSTLEKAQALNLTGWVKNTNNGEVAIMACGDEAPIMALTEWLWQGPDNAQTSHVHWEPSDYECFDHFTIKN